MNRAWIAVASAEHVERGQRAGFMQVCHGKCAPLRRIHGGDTVAYYSPVRTFGGRDRLQAFTAIGTVQHGDPYQVDLGEGFRPYRRDVAFHASHEAPIAPLLGALAFSAGKRNWGYALRFGLFEVSAEDAALIAQAMGVSQLHLPTTGVSQLHLPTMGVSQVRMPIGGAGSRHRAGAADTRA